MFDFSSGHASSCVLRNGEKKDNYINYTIFFWGSNYVGRTNIGRPPRLHLRRSQFSPWKIVVVSMTDISLPNLGQQSKSLSPDISFWVRQVCRWLIFIISIYWHTTYFLFFDNKIIFAEKLMYWGKTIRRLISILNFYF